MTIRLHINVDHVATVRNARGTRYPDPVLAALLCEQAGADGITAHLREDRRHMGDEDIDRLRAAVTSLLNLEMAATDEMIEIASRVRPDVITLVPERREERTTEGGLDVRAQAGAIAAAAAMAAERGIKLSLFIAPDRDAVDGAVELGAQQVELHTGAYCHAGSLAELGRLTEAARHAASLDLEVAAGHGLTRHNLVAVCAIDEVEELNIGHAFISDALLVGLQQTVHDYRGAIDRGLRRRPGASR
jgi:pyridoxine 5-phosphate synthase